jgi:hypothetical protein
MSSLLIYLPDIRLLKSHEGISQVPLLLCYLSPSSSFILRGMEAGTGAVLPQFSYLSTPTHRWFLMAEPVPTSSRSLFLVRGLPNCTTDVEVSLGRSKPTSAHSNWLLWNNYLLTTSLSSIHFKPILDDGLILFGKAITVWSQSKNCHWPLCFGTIPCTAWPSYPQALGHKWGETGHQRQVDGWERGLRRQAWAMAWWIHLVLVLSLWERCRNRNHKVL